MVNFLAPQVREVADVETVEMYMLSFGKFKMVPVRHDAFQIGLADLIATAGTASTELNAGFPHFLHETLNQIIIRLFQNEIEGIVAGALQLEVRAVF